MESKKFIRNNSELYIGAILILPFLILSVIAAKEIEPFFTFFKISSPMGFNLNPIGYFSLFFSLSLLPVAAIFII